MDRIGARSLVALTLAFAAACGAGGSSSVDSPPPPPPPPPPPSSDHPFLVVDPDEYASLRARAGTSPWREVAQEAARYAAQETFDPGASDYQAKTRMTDLCGALGLAYVLAPSTALVDKLRSTLALWPQYFRATAAQGSVTQVRWQQSAMVESIVALDVMHAALAPADLASIEAMIDSMVEQWWDNQDQDGTASTPGIRAIWTLYLGDRARFTAARDLFLQRWFAELTPDGVFDSGCGYAWVRQGGDRISKYALLDVLQHTGEDDSLYTDPQVIGLHEWLYGGAYTPRRKNLTFGDSDPTRNLEAFSAYMPAYRAGLLSPEAGRHAAWLLRDVSPRPLLANYVLMNDTLLDPEPPTSRLWGDMAAFWENASSESSLMGALWSPRSSGGHSHKDVNAVHLYAYGENVLRNVGFCGAGSGIDATFDWDWVSNTAASSNTVTIGTSDHSGKIGAGILEGVIAPRFDYAASGSGSAIPGGTHTRSLLMVHGEAGLPGYFVLLDEVQASSGQTVCQDLHPDASNLSTIVTGIDYQSSVRQFGSSAVLVDLFLATPASSVSVQDGGLCAFDGKDYVGKSLHACRTADSGGRSRFVTVIVPHDASHAAPALTRLPTGSFSGARLAYPGNVTDTVAESSGAALVSIGPEAFRGLATHCRRASGTLRQYFVRSGRAFDDGSVQRVGFDSDAALSLFVRGTEAHVVTTGTTATFFDPALTGGTFTSDAGTVLSAGQGFVTIRLNAGSHGFDLRTGAPRP